MIWAFRGLWFWLDSLRWRVLNAVSIEVVHGFDHCTPRGGSGRLWNLKFVEHWRLSPRLLPTEAVMRSLHSLSFELAAFPDRRCVEAFTEDWVCLFSCWNILTLNDRSLILNKDMQIWIQNQNRIGHWAKFQGRKTRRNSHPHLSAHVRRALSCHGLFLKGPETARVKCAGQDSQCLRASSWKFTKGRCLWRCGSQHFCCWKRAAGLGCLLVPFKRDSQRSDFEITFWSNHETTNSYDSLTCKIWIGPWRPGNQLRGGQKSGAMQTWMLETSRLVQMAGCVCFVRQCVASSFAMALPLGFKLGAICHCKICDVLHSCRITFLSDRVW